MTKQRGNGSTLRTEAISRDVRQVNEAGSTYDGQVRVTEGQLDAVAMRCREELAISLRRTGTDTVATLVQDVLTVRVEHSLTAAEQHLMRRSEGRAFFQHYIEELAEQIHSELKRHVEHILPYSVTYVRVVVDCDNDCILFRFGLRLFQNSNHTGVGKASSHSRQR
jgi:uncharacterized protein YbcI